VFSGIDRKKRGGAFMAVQGNFMDVATVWLHAGKGGDGAVTFHREKFVAAGGPDGGDGGRGGDIIFQADANLSTLMDFRYKRKYTAPDGGKGMGKNCHGANAEPLIIRVPLGTVVKDADSGLVIVDISDDKLVVIAKGGRGGFGNAHYATPTRQIPKFAKPGMPGEDVHITLELKLIADVGLIGFPNVGKSTLISVISAAKPKIANYHFTTLVPTLGVVSCGEGASFVCADIPGLIEGASEGVGLGHDFLRHVERCRLLMHVVDISGSEARDPKEDFEKINAELANFSPELAKRPQIVLGNKCDIATPEQIEAFRTFIEAKGLVFVPISAATMQGVSQLPGMVYARLKELPPVPVFQPEYVKPETAPGGRTFTVTKTQEHTFDIEAPWLERVLDGSNVEDYESLQYFQRQLEESGILEELVRQGVEENDTILIGEYQFDYIF
jgi:GTP-binding protein